MSKTPHHATAALARKHGISLTANGDDTWSASKDGLSSGRVPSAKEAVAAIVAQLPKAPKAKSTKKPGGKKRKSKKGKKAKSAAMSGKMRKHYYDRYRKNGGTCNDDLAIELSEAITVIDKGKSGKANRKRTDMALLFKVAKENGVDTSKYSKLNPGMARMDISNKLRAMVRAGQKVTILGKTFKGDVNPAGNAVEE